MYHLFCNHVDQNYTIVKPNHVISYVLLLSTDTYRKPNDFVRSEYRKNHISIVNCFYPPGIPIKPVVNLLEITSLIQNVSFFFSDYSIPLTSHPSFFFSSLILLRLCLSKLPHIKIRVLVELLDWNQIKISFVLGNWRWEKNIHKNLYFIASIRLHNITD